MRTAWKGGDLVNVHRTQGLDGWEFSKCPPVRTVWKGGDLVNVHRTQGLDGWGFSKCPPIRTVWKGGDLRRESLEAATFIVVIGI